MSAKKFSFMLKTFGGDFASANRLVDSFRAHNVNALHLHVVVPEADMQMFEAFASETITLIADESIPGRTATAYVNGIRPGYINQELVKLGFFRLGLTEAYLCLDSDAIFLRDFTFDDFMHSSGSPYTVLVEDRELQGNSSYYEEHWQGRSAKLDKIREFLNLPGANTYLTCHGFQILQSAVLQGLSNDILTPRGLDFLDLLEISPYEFSWYNFYLQSIDMPIFVREPYFRVIHNGQQYSTELMSGMSQAVWTRGYLGLVVNSNFQHTSRPLPYDNWAPLVMAMYAKPLFLLTVWGRVTMALLLSAGRFPVSMALKLKRRVQSR
jgi:hypothetical protein